MVGQSRARINDLDQLALVYWNETSTNQSDEHFLEYYIAPTGFYEDFFDTVNYLQEPICTRTTSTKSAKEVGTAQLRSIFSVPPSNAAN